MRRRDGTPRKVSVSGVPLPPGRHELPGCLAVVGRRSGPRLAVGGDGPLAAAVFRRLWRTLDPDALAGSVVLAPGAAEITVRTAVPATLPHLRADLRRVRTAARARAFGVAVVVDDPRARGLIYEAPDDLAGVEQAVAGLVALCGGRAAPRPAERIVAADVRRLRAGAGGDVVLLARPGTVVAAGAPLYEVWRHGAARTVRAARRCVVLHAAAAAERGAPAARIAGVRRIVRRRRPRRGVTVGWCETVALPELGVPRLAAKIDTGARTSALHAVFRVLGDEVELRHGRVPLRGWVTVRDSGGHAERRPVIETTLALGPLVRRVRLTLTHRGDMRFPMLVGRSALGPGVVVDPGRKNLLRRGRSY